jgi:parallel beta-helix repeat protein
MTEEVVFAPSTVTTPRPIEVLPCVITEPGRYYLVRDQIGLSAPRAVEIRASDVVLNGSGHTVSAAAGAGQYGVLVYGSSGLANVTVTDLALTGWGEGLAFYGVDGGGVSGCTVTGSSFAGVSLDGGARNVSIRSSALSANGMGVFIRNSQNATVERNVITDSVTAGLSLYSSGGHRIVDNRLVNDVNVLFSGGVLPNTWNGPKTAGTNVVGGPMTGGNYWGRSDRRGWSETHWDEDRDGLADGPYDLRGDGTNVDRLPLVQYVAAPPPVVPGGMGRPADLDGDGWCEDVNGNGRKDCADVTLFFAELEWCATNEPVAILDFNGNGRLDFADVVWLFRQL